MSINDLPYFTQCQTPDSVRALYKELAKRHHPDIGGDTATMQSINAQYAYAIDQARRQDLPDQTEEQYQTMADIDERIRQAIEAIIRLAGIEIEVCGLWVWVSGNTKPVKDLLKAAGYRWARKKLKWYYPGIPANGRGRYTMGDIRTRYGSKRINGKNEEIPQLA